MITTTNKVEALQKVCRNSRLLFVRGDDVLSFMRRVIASTNIQASVFIIDTIDSVEITPTGDLAPVGDVVTNTNEIPIFQIEYDVYMQIETLLTKPCNARIWVYKEVKDDAGGRLYESHFRLYEADKVPIVVCERGVLRYVDNYDDMLKDMRSAQLDTWYMFVMQLYDDILRCPSMQSFALFFINVYSFIEALSVEIDARRCLESTLLKTPAVYHDLLRTMFNLRLQFYHEVYKRDEIWERIIEILNDPMLLSLLQKYFVSNYHNLKDIKAYYFLAANMADEEKGREL